MLYDYVITALVKSTDVVTYALKILLIYKFVDKKYVSFFLYIDAIGILISMLLTTPFYNLFIKESIRFGKVRHTIKTFNTLTALTIILSLIFGTIMYGLYVGIYLVTKIMEISIRTLTVELIMKRKFKGLPLPSIISTFIFILLIPYYNVFIVMTISNITIVITFILISKEIRESIFYGFGLDVTLIRSELIHYASNGIYNIITTNGTLVLVGTLFGNLWIYLFKIPSAIGNTMYTILNQLLPTIMRYRDKKRENIILFAIVGTFIVLSMYTISPLIAKFVNINEVHTFKLLTLIWLIISMLRFVKDVIYQKSTIYLHSKNTTLVNTILSTILLLMIPIYSNIYQLLSMVLITNIIIIIYMMFQNKHDKNIMKVEQ